jgi:hypothetical protein
MQLPADPLVLNSEPLLSSPLLLLLSTACWLKEQLERLLMLLLMLSGCEDPAGVRPLPWLRERLHMQQQWATFTSALTTAAQAQRSAPLTRFAVTFKCAQEPTNLPKR